MFTGIIEHVGTIESLDLRRDGGHIAILAPSVAPSLAVSNSIAINGCCLTVVSRDTERFSADLSGETLSKTSFRELKPGARVNLEQPLTAGKELGGHFVLGHIDNVGRVTHLTAEGDNWWLGVQVPEDFARYIVPKGSVTIDGISLPMCVTVNPATRSISKAMFSENMWSATSKRAALRPRQTCRYLASSKKASDYNRRNACHL